MLSDTKYAMRSGEIFRLPFYFSTTHTHAKGGAINRGTRACRRSDSPKWDNDRKARKIAAFTLSTRTPSKTHRATEPFVTVGCCLPFAVSPIGSPLVLTAPSSRGPFAIGCNVRHCSVRPWLVRACAREKSRSNRSGKGDYLYATRKLYKRLVQETFPLPPLSLGRGKSDRYRWMKDVGKGNDRKCTVCFSGSVHER